MAQVSVSTPSFKSLPSAKRFACPGEPTLRRGLLVRCGRGVTHHDGEGLEIRRRFIVRSWSSTSCELRKWICQVKSWPCSQNWTCVAAIWACLAPRPSATSVSAKRLELERSDVSGRQAHILDKTAGITPDISVQRFVTHKSSGRHYALKTLKKAAIIKMKQVGADSFGVFDLAWCCAASGRPHHE